MFILASQSPQRKKILKDLKIPFKAIPADIDEFFAEKILKRPHAIARAIALKKAEVISKKYPNDWVIGSDTLVVSKSGKILGKPANRTEAKKMLDAYQNAFCDVYSGIAMVHQTLKKKFVDYDRTRLHFSQLPKNQLDAYLDSEDWKERSGGITIEEAGAWVTKIEGEYWNVVGLPVDKLKEMLESIN